MATFTKFQPFVENLAEKVFNLQSDTLKWLLTNSAPLNTYNQKSSLTEISAGNGYSADGVTITVSSSAQSGGTYKNVIADATLTASGGPIGPFRYAVVYDSTATNSELIGFFDYGSSITLADGETFTFDADPTNGLLQIS